MAWESQLPVTDCPIYATAIFLQNACKHGELNGRGSKRRLYILQLSNWQLWCLHHHDVPGGQSAKLIVRSLKILYNRAAQRSKGTPIPSQLDPATLWGDPFGDAGFFMNSPQQHIVEIASHEDNLGAGTQTLGAEALSRSSPKDRFSIRHIMRKRQEEIKLLSTGTQKLNNSQEKTRCLVILENLQPQLQTCTTVMKQLSQSSKFVTVNQ